jgi:hypothetical protein
MAVLESILQHSKKAKVLGVCDKRLEDKEGRLSEDSGSIN